PVAGDAVLGSIRVDGLYGVPVAPIGVDLMVESPHFTAAFFTPDDQGPVPNSLSERSDVNVGGPIVVEDFATGVSVGTRIGGNDRYETAADIALTGGCSQAAVVASGEDFADALSANYLAGALSTRFGDNVPVLLTRGGDLPASSSS